MSVTLTDDEVTAIEDLLHSLHDGLGHDDACLVRRLLRVVAEMKSSKRQREYTIGEPLLMVDVVWQWWGTESDS